jgi:hypothetical protein
VPLGQALQQHQQPERTRIASAGVASASAASLRSQSGRSAISAGGKLQPRSSAGTSAAAMPERSPCRTPDATRSSAVEPPSMKEGPPKIALPGWWCRCQASTSVAARLLPRIIGAVTGMYFVVPEVVPEESAKYGTRPGQVTSTSTG